MKQLAISFLFVTGIWNQCYSQIDSLATIHFYSAKPTIEQAKSFEILEGSESLVISDGGLEVLHRCTPGSYTFFLKEGSSININAQIGGEYFVEILLGAPQTFKLKSKSEGEEDLRKLRTGNY